MIGLFNSEFDDIGVFYVFVFVWVVLKIFFYVNFMNIFVIGVGNEVLIGFMNVLLFLVLVMNNIYNVFIVNNF